MRLRSPLAVLAATVALAAGTAAVPAYAASPEEATAKAGQCESWQDENTYGYHCWGYAGGKVQATAQCKNGEITHGDWASMVTGEWSYAYCDWGGGLSSGQPNFS